MNKGIGRILAAGASAVALMGAWQGSAQTTTAPTSATADATVQPTDIAKAAPANSGDAIVVTGVRGAARTVQNSPVPIDHFGAKEIAQVPQTDTLNVLQTLIPSLEISRQPNSSTGSFIRPISLRGLSEDKTLILLNSKRRQKSASVGISGTGAQGEDSSIIPALALKSVEVLRDGAAAQYGSDAIAGVINFILKDDDHGGDITMQTGQYYKGDGTSYMIAANKGMKLTDRGFINVTAEYTNDDRTVRANQFTSSTFNAVAYAAANPAYAALVNLNNPLQRWGQPKSHAFRSVVNSGIDLTDDIHLYAFGNWSKSKSTADANYRYPGNGQAVNDTPVRLADGSVFTFTSLFPAGFTPLFSGLITDWSATGGVRGSKDIGGNDFTYDLSGRYGWDKEVYQIINTVNPSIGPSSPRSFTPSQYINNETALNADFTYKVPVDFFASPLVVSAGGEYRHEVYEIRTGDYASYEAGLYSTANPYGFCTAQHTLSASAPQNAGINCANYLAGSSDGYAGIDPTYNVLSVGSNGITGLPPTAAGQWGVKSESAYGELSTDILKHWFVDLAGRFEHYSSSGSTVNGKLATRYEFLPGFAIRGSVGAGFHAPSPGLLNTTSVSIQTVAGVYTLAGLFPASNPVSQFLGAKALKPEKSVNYSAGFTANPMPGLTLSVDGYLINIHNQIYSTAPITVTSAIRAQMVAAGVAGAASISSVNFFQNAFSSTTKGIDFVGDYNFRWANGQRTGITASFNANWFKVDKLNIANLFANYLTYNFKHLTPRWRSTWTETQQIGPFQLLVRENVYGPYSAMSTAAPFPTQHFNPQVQADVELSYRFGKGYTLAVGARNVFNEYPARDKLQPTAGRIYRADSVVDWQGGFYYGRITAHF